MRHRNKGSSSMDIDKVLSHLGLPEYEYVDAQNYYYRLPTHLPTVKIRRLNYTMRKSWAVRVDDVLCVCLLLLPLSSPWGWGWEWGWFRLLLSYSVFFRISNFSSCVLILVSALLFLLCILSTFFVLPKLRESSSDFGNTQLTDFSSISAHPNVQ